MVRLRVSIHRNGLPSTNILWNIPDAQLHAKTTTYNLVEQINDVVPLDAEGWGLEDYIVLVGGFECLHFAELKNTLKDEDEVTIRPLQTAEVRARTLAGRLQISSDGRRLVDGVPFGRPLLRKPVRPPVRIPRSLMGILGPVSGALVLAEGQEDNSDHEADEDTREAAFEAVTAQREARAKRLQTRRRTTITDVQKRTAVRNTAKGLTNISPNSEISGTAPDATDEDMTSLPSDFEDAEDLDDGDFDDENSDVNSESGSDSSDSSITSSDSNPTGSEMSWEGIDDTPRPKTRAKKKHPTRAESRSNSDSDSDSDMGSLSSSSTAGSTSTASQSPGSSGSGVHSKPADDTSRKPSSGQRRRANAQKRKKAADTDEPPLILSPSLNSAPNSSNSASKEIASQRATLKLPASQPVVTSPLSNVSASAPIPTLTPDPDTHYRPVRKASAYNEGTKNTKARNVRRRAMKMIKFLVREGELPAGAGKLEYDRWRSIHVGNDARDDSTKDLIVNTTQVDTTLRGESGDLNQDDQSAANVSRDPWSSTTNVHVEHTDSSDDKTLEDACTEVDPPLDGLTHGSAEDAARNQLLARLALKGTDVSDHDRSTQTTVNKSPREEEDTRTSHALATGRSISTGTVSSPPEFVRNEDARMAAERAIPHADGSTQSASTDAAPTNTTAGRARLDLDSSKRMLFASLGVRVPKTRADRDKVQQQLTSAAKLSRPKAPPLNPEPVTVRTHDDGPIHNEEPTHEEENPNFWKSKIRLSAVECCDKGVELSTPPFPFYQRWDPQQQASFKKRKRGDQTKYSAPKKKRKSQRRQEQEYDGVGDENGEYNDEAYRAQEFEDEWDPAAMEGWEADNVDDLASLAPVRGVTTNGHGGDASAPYNDGDGLNYDDEQEPAAASSVTRKAARSKKASRITSDDAAASQLKQEMIESQSQRTFLDDLPALPPDIATLPPLSISTAEPGDIVTFKQLEVSAATGWTPAISAQRTASIVSIDNTQVELKLAKRDLPNKVKEYDDNGNRVYAKFEMADLSEDEEEDEGTLEVSWDELVEPRLLAKAERVDAVEGAELGGSSVSVEA
ncbi:hypothetical protein LTR66_008271 [Elasticomyces elasticus]|nr:hypothetical protein LTR66_008271 [Elasticomyces elasticus]